MTPLLGKYPSIKGVMAYNDPSAIGAYSAARSPGVTSTAARAVRTAAATRSARSRPAARRSRSSSTTRAWARTGRGGCTTCSEGVKIPTTIKAGPPVLVDKANVDSIVSWETAAQAGVSAAAEGAPSMIETPPLVPEGVTERDGRPRPRDARPARGVRAEHRHRRRDRSVLVIDTAMGPRNGRADPRRGAAPRRRPQAAC